MLCLHCNKEESKKRNLCAKCLELPRCDGCDILFGELANASKDNPKRCDMCVNYEKNIKSNCVNCGDKIPKYYYKNTKKLQFLVRGNYCGKCNSKIIYTVSRKKEEANSEIESV